LQNGKVLTEKIISISKAEIEQKFASAIFFKEAYYDQSPVINY
jgi:hypothetical protein